MSLQVIKPCDGGTTIIHSTEHCDNCGEDWASCCCPKSPEVPCEGDCGKILVTNLATCSESQLNANKCTLIVKNAVGDVEACQYTPRSIILSAYNTVNTSSICDDIPDNYLDFYNDAVREVNSKIDTLWELSEAIVKTCGRCEFYAPPKYVQVISVTNEVVNCNQNCSAMKYRYVNAEQWAASRVLDSWSLKGRDTIIIKDPVTCGCSAGIPNFLKVTYYKKIDMAKSLDECLDIEDDAVNVIKDLIIMDSLGVKFNNQLAISRAIDRYKSFLDTFKTRDAKKVNTAPFKIVRPAFRIRG